jgi:hypothetical protein
MDCPYLIDLIDHIYSNMLGTSDAIEEVKAGYETGGTQCTFRRLQESPIRDPAFAMTVES